MQAGKLKDRKIKQNPEVAEQVRSRKISDCQPCSTSLNCHIMSHRNHSRLPQQKSAFPAYTTKNMEKVISKKVKADSCQ